MQCNKTILPGINSIGCTLCADLPSAIPFIAMGGCEIDMPDEVVDIPFSGSPTCEVVQSKAEHGTKESATLQFYTSREIRHCLRLAFVIGTVDGKKYLIGAKEPPFPICEVTLSTGSADGVPAVYSVKVTCKSVKALARIAL